MYSRLHEKEGNVDKTLDSNHGDGSKTKVFGWVIGGGAGLNFSPRYPTFGIESERKR